MDESEKSGKAPKYFLFVLFLEMSCTYPVSFVQNVLIPMLKYLYFSNQVIYIIKFSPHWVSSTLQKVVILS